MIERAASVALSIGFYLGNMDSSFKTYTDKELTNRLQELMENPRPIKDDSYSDSDEKLFDYNIITKNLKDIRLIKLSLSTSNSTAYTDGSIAVNIQLRKGALIKEGRFSCYVYTEDYSPMCNSDATYKFDREASNKASIIMLSFRIWLPGNYFLLVRDKTNGSLFRIDFEISKLMNIMQQPLVMRPICSIDDILTTYVENGVTKELSEQEHARNYISENKK